MFHVCLANKACCEDSSHQRISRRNPVLPIFAFQGGVWRNMVVIVAPLKTDTLHFLINRYGGAIYAFLFSADIINNLLVTWF